MNSGKTTSEQQSFSDPDIEQLLADLEAEQEKFALMGQQDGSKNMPVAEAFWRAKVHIPVQNRVKAIIDIIQSRLLPVSGMVSRTAIAGSVEPRVQALQAEIDAHTLRAQSLWKTMGNNLPNKSQEWWRKVVQVCVMLMGIFDGSLGYDAFRNGLTIWAASLYGVGIFIVLWIGSRLLSDYAMKAPTKRLRKIRVCCGALVAAGIFACLGYARARFYNAAHADIGNGATDITLWTTPHISGFLLFCISYGLFLASLFFCMMVHKTKEEEMRAQAYGSAKKEYDKLNDSIRQNWDRIGKIRQEAIDQDVQAKQVYEYAIAAKKRAISIGAGCLSKYAETDIAFRRDGLCPRFFSDPTDFNEGNFFHHS